ncbi:MAG TPA: M14 family zinc carboxypeptidase, partial [Gemmatimonadaceae bacterium]|nr:M14 family zinc carboxypeptidase [Gemmatimonadaceae bacterium]
MPHPRVLLALATTLLALRTVSAQPATNQRIDEEYTRLIRQHLTDPRITTELVDYLPASDKVPTPLSFPGIGRVVGTPGYLTKARDIHRYLEAIAKAAPERARFQVIGKTEEGRDMVAFIVSDEETMADPERYQGYMRELADPRRTSEARARELINGVAKPVYYLTSGIHSTETGGPEMLMELAYRLVVDESPRIANIRKHVITIITPVVEV